VNETKAEVEYTVPIAEDLYSTIKLMAEEHGLTVEVIVDTIFRMAFEAASLEEILEDMRDV